MASLLFRNGSRRAWAVCVYQDLSQARQLETVAWLAATAAPGAEARMAWTSALSVVLGKRVSSAQHAIYLVLERAETESGSHWRVFDDGREQRLERVGDTPLAGQILVSNDSSRVASPGVAVSAAPICFAPAVPGGATAQFVLRPTHYVALFRDVRAGEVLRRPIIAPLPLPWGSDATDGTLHVYERGSNLILDLQPGGTLRVPLDRLDD